MGPFMEPSTWWMTPDSMSGMSGAWQGKQAEGNQMRSLTPSSAAAWKSETPILSPLRKWWCELMRMPSRRPAFLRAVLRASTGVEQAAARAGRSALGARAGAVVAPCVVDPPPAPP